VNNAETHRKRAKEWYYANPQRAKEQRKKWGTDNLERKRELNAAWRQRNLLKVQKRAVTKEATRRAQKRASAGTFTPQDVEFILKAQRHHCAYCRKRLSKRYHIDHIVALARGGSNDSRNIQALCPTCNIAKGAKHPIDFAQLRGLLI
jgi:5-methylcytosine-specific restriction endonuclease McrA